MGWGDWSVCGSMIKTKRGGKGVKKNGRRNQYVYHRVEPKLAWAGGLSLMPVDRGVRWLRGCVVGLFTVMQGCSA